MKIPFTVEQFFAIFQIYNEAVWPAQALLLALALIAVSLVFMKRRFSGPAVSAILALLWGWIAVVYHFAFFTRINPLAYGFAVLSLIGAGIFFWQGVVRRKLEFEVGSHLRSYTGVTLIVFALLVYPTWSWLAGHSYPAMPTFGLPCPTTIFTIGLLAFLKAPAPRSPYIVPVLWSAIGGQAAFLLDVPQDLGLAAAGVVGIVMLARNASPRQTITA
jgi:hypothetical protein